MFGGRFLSTLRVICMKRNRREATGREHHSKGINCALLFVWIVVLLGWFYATVVLMLDSRFELGNQSPTRAGHYELRHR
jgi:hypothetical protein